MSRLTNRHNPNLTIDARDFDRTMNELMRFTGKTFKEIINHEAARILVKVIKKTKPSQGGEKGMMVKRITVRYSYKDDSNPHPKMVGRVKIRGRRRNTRKIRKKGMMVMKGRGKNRKKVWDPNRNNPDWKLLQDELKRLRLWKLARIGQSKATWLYIAKRAKIKGVDVGVPGYVKTALLLFTSNLKSVINGTSAPFGKHNWVVTMKNFGKVAMIRGGRRRGADGFNVFRNAYNGRVGYFKENLAQGVFEKTKKITSKYRGLMVSPVSNKRGSDPV